MIKAHHKLDGIMLINGKAAKALFDTGTIGAKFIGAAFVTTHAIPYTIIKKPTEIRMAMKGSRSKRYKE